MRFFLYILMAVLSTCFVGCTSPRLEWAMRDKPVGTPFSPQNLYRADELPPQIQRVLFVPVKSEHVGWKESARINEIFIAELRRSERFSVVESDSKLALSKSNKRSSLDLKALAAMAEQYDVQAILELKLTHFRAYKPLAIGVDARLFTLDPEKPEIVWALDSLFDAGQDSVALGARMHAQGYHQQVFPLASTYSSLSVPSRFAAYVAHTVFRTLPKI